MATKFLKKLEELEAEKAQALWRRMLRAVTVWDGADTATRRVYSPRAELHVNADKGLEVSLWQLPLTDIIKYPRHPAKGDWEFMAPRKLLRLWHSEAREQAIFTNQLIDLANSQGETYEPF